MFEKWDIGEWYNVGAGYVHHMYSMNNHRVISMQHKCIEPLGESKSDYDIFLAITERLGLGAVYSEGGTTELDWCKRVFDSSDLAEHISWRQFLKKGYFVVPPESDGGRAPVANRWFYEGRRKDTPEPYPLPSDYVGEYLNGIQTPSGKFEFVASTLKRIDDPDRPPLNRYMPTYEDPSREPELAGLPLKLLTGHTRYAFHVMGDDESSSVWDIREHRIKKDGHYYLVARIHPKDAESRGIADGDLIRLWNRRASVVCAAQVTARIQPGTVSAYAGSAQYKPLGEPGRSTDLGGCVNMLNTHKPITSKAHGMRPEHDPDRGREVDRCRHLAAGGGSLMAKKWNLIVDVARCDNCRVCFLAVKDEHVGNDFPGYSAAQPEHGANWLDIERKERGTYPLVEAHFMPVMCNHCDAAPCMKAARTAPCANARTAS